MRCEMTCPEKPVMEEVRQGSFLSPAVRCTRDLPSSSGTLRLTLLRKVSLHWKEGMSLRDLRAAPFTHFVRGPLSLPKSSSIELA